MHRFACNNQLIMLINHMREDFGVMLNRLQLSDDQLQAKTDEFKKRYAEGEHLESIRAEAFAVCREAAKRVLEMYPFRVQILGAAALDEGNIAEMKTGEGKTLTATMAVYLNAITGKGVHVVTVNEYLASRDAAEMGQLYNFLGLSVGLNLNSLSKDEKRTAYELRHYLKMDSFL